MIGWKRYINQSFELVFRLHPHPQMAWDMYFPSNILKKCLCAPVHKQQYLNKLYFMGREEWDSGNLRDTTSRLKGVVENTQGWQSDGHPPLSGHLGRKLPGRLFRQKKLELCKKKRQKKVTTSGASQASTTGDKGVVRGEGADSSRQACSSPYKPCTPHPLTELHSTFPQCTRQGCASSCNPHTRLSQMAFQGEGRYRAELPPLPVKYLIFMLVLVNHKN